MVTRASEEEAGEKLRRAGADTVLTPFSMAGRQLADVLLRPQVFEFMDFARSNIGTGVVMEQVRVTPRTEVTAKTFGELLELQNRASSSSPIRKEGGQTTFNPPPEFAISAGDVLIVMGERADLQKLEKILTT